MAQIQQQIDPLDLTPSTGVGVALPFNGPGVFNINYTTNDQIKSNLIHVVLTEPGELINKPNFGAGLNSLLFEQSISKDDLQIKIQEAVAQDTKLNRMITISDIILNQDINTNTIRVTIEYILNLIGIGNVSEGGPAPYEQVNNK